MNCRGCRSNTFNGAL